MLRSQRLERELDRAVAQWLDWLPRWDPSILRRTSPICSDCPAWIAALSLDGVPHGAMHALVTSLDALVAEHFTRCAAAWFPALALNDDVKVWIADGVVRIARADGLIFQDLSDSAELADTATDLTRMHEQIRQDAYVWVHRSRGSILAVLEEAVEPKIRRMTEDLLSEIDAA
jgi:hypothetical protein